MDPNQPLLLANSATCRFLAFDELAIQSAALPGVITDADATVVRILSYFTKPSTPREAFEALSEGLGVGREDFELVTGSAVENKLLLPVGAAAPEPESIGPEIGFASPLHHHLLLRDDIRITAYRSAIFKHVRGKSVLDLGAGSGIMSVFAGQAGAARITAIEETRIVGLARDMARANGIQADFLHGNSLNLTLDERVDVIVHELIGTDIWDEDMLASIHDARHRFLKPGGRLIPSGIDVFCCGIEARRGVGRQEYATQAEALGARYGIDSAPLAAAVRKAVRFDVGSVVHELPMGRRGILSRDVKLYSLDYHEDLDLTQLGGKEFELQIDRPGRLNSLLVFFNCRMDEELVLSTSPRSAQTSWGWIQYALARALRVAAGEGVALRCKIETVRGRPYMMIGLA